MDPLLPTPALLSVFIVTQGCLPMIFNPGAVAGETPVPGRALTLDERKRIGLTGPGATIGYRVGDTDVFFDMAGDQATVWFGGGDFSVAGVLLEETLRKLFKAEELTVRLVPGPPGKITRTCEIVVAPAGSSRAALLSVTFGPSADTVGDARTFFCRIYPQERRG